MHRFDERGPGISGQIIGLGGFAFSGPSNRQNWVRAGVDLEHRLGPNTVLAASLNAASRGQDPDVSAAISIKTTF